MCGGETGNPTNLENQTPTKANLQKEAFEITNEIPEVSNPDIRRLGPNAGGGASPETLRKRLRSLVPSPVLIKQVTDHPGIRGQS